VQIDPGFKKTFDRLQNLERHARNLGIATAFFSFPLGLFVLLGFRDGRCRSPYYLVLNSFLGAGALVVMLRYAIPALVNLQFYIPGYGLLLFLLYWVYVAAFFPLFCLTVASVVVGIKVNALERTLLKANPFWYLSLRGDPLALQGRLTHRDVQFRQLSNIKNQCVWLGIVVCITCPPAMFIACCLNSARALRATSLFLLCFFLPIFVGGIIVAMVMLFLLRPLWVLLPPLCTAWGVSLALSLMASRWARLEEEFSLTKGTPNSPPPVTGFGFSVWRF
jgi:ABC-type sugar transport system permease subunit